MSISVVCGMQWNLSNEGTFAIETQVDLVMELAADTGL